MIGIDWVAVVVLGVAFAFSNVRTAPVWLRNAVFALALFIVAGYRLVRGAQQGLGMIFVLIAIVFGVQYLVRAIRAYKAGRS